MWRIDTGPTGVVLRENAVSRWGRRRIRTALTLGELLQPWPGVLVDAVRAREPLTIITAAWLSVGAEALVAGPTAAFLHGLTAVPPTPVHLVRPYEVRKVRRKGVLIHNGTGLERDRVDRYGLPVLCLERTVTDIACTASPPDSLAVLDEFLASRPEEARPAVRRALYERLQDRPDTRGTRIAMRLVDLATGRARSTAESWLLWRIVDLGFPVPEVNAAVRGIDGSLLYLVDLAWPELRIAVEYNGYAAHVDRSAADRARIRDLERRGWIVIVVYVEDLTDTARLEKELQEAFGKRGVDLRGRTKRTLRPRRHRDRPSR